MLVIKNAAIYTPDHVIAQGAVLADAGRIQAVGPAADVPCPDAAQVIDAAGLLLVPGFMDMQINGAFGDDFTSDPATIWRAAERLPRFGVTSFLPTIISSPLTQITAGQQIVIAGRPAGFRGARPLGLHVEGPFLNPHKKGAHNPNHLRQPDLRAVADWSPTAGVRLATLAPELPGAREVIAALSGRGVLVSAGHSMATYAQAAAGFDAGARGGTHLFNAMPALGHRDPGLAGALLADDRLTVGFIADGIHTHPAVIKLVWRALGSGRLALVTDATAALGMPPGRYRLGDAEVMVDAASCRLADGALAGSILSLDQALRNLVAVGGCTLVEALPTVTTTPARAIGLSHVRGRIAAGCLADMVLLTPDLHVHATIVEGDVVYGAAE
ncbi:N-acetylglucosamine-6-phosphate deacetylase [Candidatus Amarolinea aalborgensis]|uniref:N-acetylglucosamine-6-phosphate deacetylase n=1 Tax=Candidatus Amarolinea aalborgensis TaxID=2249329 RepID=UPI003BF992CC